MRFRIESQRRIVILLTDGNDGTSKVPLRDAILAVQVGDIVIFAIDTRFITRKRAGHEEEQKVAEETEGKCFEYVLGKELGDAFKNIQTAIENEYFLTYVPTAESRARIRVRADNLRVLAPRQR
jgi:hypothetical protein